jgi:hypothetical protein
VNEKYRVYEDMAARDGSRFINEPVKPTAAHAPTPGDAAA